MTNKTIDKRIKNSKIKRNIYGALAGASLLFTGGNLYNYNSITIEAPENYHKVKKLENQISNLYDLKGKIHPANDYVPSTQEIKESYERQDQIYSNAIGHCQKEISGLTNSLERNEFQDYEKKKSKNQGLSLLGILMAFGFISSTFTKQNQYKTLKEYCKIEKSISTLNREINKKKGFTETL